MKYLKVIGLSAVLSLAACGKTVSPVKGLNGQDGYNSLVDISRIQDGLVVASGLDLDRDGVLSQHEIQAVETVLDGVNGVDGQNGIDGQDGEDAKYFVTEVVDPCGASSGPDEILLVTNAGIMAWYKNVGLVLLEDGNYVTTDSQRCRFSVQDGKLL